MLISLILFSLFAQAQFYSFPAPVRPIPVHHDPALLTDAVEMLVPHNIDLRCTAVRTTPVATYYTLQQYINDIPVEHVLCKAIVQQDQLIAVLGNYYGGKIEVSLPEHPTFGVSQIHEQAGIPAGTALQRVLLREENALLQLYKADHQDTHSRAHTTWYFTADGTLRMRNDHRTYFALPDTVVHALVFLPDPITSAETDYAGDYKDLGDADNDALNNERFAVTMPAQFVDGVFYLRTDSILLKDLNAPAIPVVTAITDTFYFTRSQDGFEDVNTLYHLTAMAQYLTSIGYDALHDFYIEVDPHGASGADQSFYVSAAIPSIQYGEGGVDDAEDADVIIHEFTHALSDHASPGSNTGLERRAIDEGYGDYFAVSHSRTYSDYKWEEVFTWDGHNEFWFGRNADTDKHYPEDNSDNIYAASEIWSGALMDIFDLIGKEACDQLVCEALYASVPNMTMPEAAQVIVDAEEMLFGGIYHTQVFSALNARGLIYPESIETAAQENGVTFANTQAFAEKSGDLMITLPYAAQVTWQITDITGRLLASGNAASIEISIPPIPHYSGPVCISLHNDAWQAAITTVIFE